jgi:hypothetical protein
MILGLIAECLGADAQVTQAHGQDAGVVLEVDD